MLRRWKLWTTGISAQHIKHTNRRQIILSSNCNTPYLIWTLHSRATAKTAPEFVRIVAKSSAQAYGLVGHRAEIRPKEGRHDGVSVFAPGRFGELRGVLFSKRFDDASERLLMAALDQIRRHLSELCKDLRHASVIRR